MAIRKVFGTALCLGLSMAGAAEAKKKPPVPEPPVDVTQYEWSTKPGANTITGEAMLRTRGGDVKTCAGLAVYLLPVTDHSDAYARRAFLSTTKGIYVPPLFGKAPTLSPDVDPYIKRKTCNSQGQFTFSALPDGEYYVVATVTWEAPTRYGMSMQGGDVMTRTQVQGGETKELTVTQ